MQELGTMNIAMRLITEDNIDQLDSMSYSDNARKLFHYDFMTLWLGDCD